MFSAPVAHRVEETERVASAGDIGIMETDAVLFGEARSEASPGGMEGEVVRADEGVLRDLIDGGGDKEVIEAAALKGARADGKRTFGNDELFQRCTAAEGVSLNPTERFGQLHSHKAYAIGKRTLAERFQPAGNAHLLYRFRRLRLGGPAFLFISANVSAVAAQNTLKLIGILEAADEEFLVCHFLVAGENLALHGQNDEIISKTYLRKRGAALKGVSADLFDGFGESKAVNASAFGK